MSEVKQKHREWLNSLNDEMFAYWLSDTCAWAMEEFRNGNHEKANWDYWKKWLKEDCEKYEVS